MKVAMTNEPSSYLKILYFPRSFIGSIPVFCYGSNTHGIFIYLLWNTVHNKINKYHHVGLVQDNDFKYSNANGHPLTSKQKHSIVDSISIGDKNVFAPHTSIGSAFWIFSSLFVDSLHFPNSFTTCRSPDSNLKNGIHAMTHVLYSKSSLLYPDFIN